MPSLLQSLMKQGKTLSLVVKTLLIPRPISPPARACLLSLGSKTYPQSNREEEAIDNLLHHKQ
jgi:hypothetical protein